MEQHPIPQQISTYQFRLVGDMTLRQFSQLAGGVVVAILFYSLPIISLIKWPLIIFFVFLGFALAFLPLEDRPLDKWIVAFFKSIYTPTQFIWKKEKRVPEFLLATLAKVEKKPLPPLAPVASKTPLIEYLETFSKPTPAPEEDKEEFLALERIEALFKTTKIPLGLTPTKQPKTKIPTLSDQLMPQLKIKPRKLVIPPSQPVALKMGLPILGPQPEPPMPPTLAEPTAPYPKIKISPIVKETSKLRVEATLSKSMPIPTTPTQPNIIVGMVLDSEGKISENAIIEIRDKDSLPVRALRSNRLGQFQIVTPLPNGTYEIEVEKDDLNFDIIKLKLTGEIISPIEIRAK